MLRPLYKLTTDHSNPSSDQFIYSLYIYMRGIFFYQKLSPNNLTIVSKLHLTKILHFAHFVS